MGYFFTQKTAYDMRISGWSSDVCSSDLVRRHRDTAHVFDLATRDRFAIADQCQRFEQRARQPRRLLLIQARYPFGVISAHLDAPTAGDFAQLGGACFEVFRQPRERVANVLLGHAKIVAESSADRREGRECVRTCRFRRSQVIYKKKIKRE